jgi:putative ABC transport system permease protein
MIARWAVKSLVRERGAFAGSAGGIAAALLVVLLLEAMFAGEAERIVAYVEKGGADVWVMQGGVAHMHMASSLMRRELAAAVTNVPGVAAATPILYVSTFLEAGGDQWFSYVVGLSSDALRGGPWAMTAGRNLPGPGEAVIPDVLAARARLTLGGTIDLLGRSFRVVGISSGTYSMANSITFVSYADLGELLSAPQAASYFLVESTGIVSSAELAERIRQAVPDLNAMSREALAASDRRVALQMGVDIIAVMTWVGSLLAALIVAFTSYASTVRRRREFGIAKALGVGNAALYRSVLLQTALVCALGYATSLALVFALRPGIQRLVPEIALVYSPASVVRLALATLVVAALASLVPVRRIGSIEPGAVFRG